MRLSMPAENKVLPAKTRGVGLPQIEYQRGCNSDQAGLKEHHKFRRAYKALSSSRYSAARSLGLFTERFRARRSVLLYFEARVVVSIMLDPLSDLTGQAPSRFSKRLWRLIKANNPNEDIANMNVAASSCKWG